MPTQKTLFYMGRNPRATKYQLEKNKLDSKLAALVNMRETLSRKLETLSVTNQDNLLFGMVSDMQLLIDFSASHDWQDVASLIHEANNGYEAIISNLVVAIDRLDELIAANKNTKISNVLETRMI